MTMDESKRTKGQLRKLEVLRESAGDALGNEVFTKRPAGQQEASASPKPDSVAHRIEPALAGSETGPTFNPGRYGYTIRRAAGKGA